MRLLIITTILLAAPGLAAAQFPAEVQPGTRVRVWIPEAARQNEGPYRRQLLRGNVESVDGATLRLRIPGSANTLAIPRASVRRLDISRGVNRGESMIERAAGGAIGGAITYALMNDPKRTGGPHYKRDWRAAGVGASWGAGIGAVIGLIFPHESWHRVIR
jgi:hypothetical protein